MTKTKKKGKGTIVIILGIIVLISVIGGFILFSGASPFAPKYSLTVTVKDAYGYVEGANVDVAGNTYITDSTGSITPLILARDTYVIVVTALEHGTKMQTLDLVSDIDLIIELDYTHQYLIITSPVDGDSIPSTDAEHDSTYADIIFWVEGTYLPGRQTGTHIRTFVDSDTSDYLSAITSISPRWRAKVYVGHVSAGSHTLYVQCVSGSTVIEQQSIEIIIPAEWHVYSSTVGLADWGEGICRGCIDDNQQWLGMNPPFPGQVTRIVGEFYLDILGNEPCEVWVDLWNPSTNRWVIVEKILDTQSGWNTFDVGVDYVNTNWWGLAGCHWYYDETKAYNKVTEFKGEVWMVAGTHYYNVASINILDWLTDQFFPGEGENTAGPAPSTCDDCGILMSMDSSDSEGNTPIALLVLCIAISSILIIGVAVYIMRRR